MDATLTMTPPPPCFTIWRCAHLQPRNTPLRLMPTTAFQPLTEISSGRARTAAAERAVVGGGPPPRPPADARPPGGAARAPGVVLVPPPPRPPGGPRAPR